MNWVFVVVVGGSICLALLIYFWGKHQEKVQERKDQQQAG
jgi:hypothetical protein